MTTNVTKIKNKTMLYMTDRWNNKSYTLVILIKIRKIGLKHCYHHL